MFLGKNDNTEGTRGETRVRNPDNKLCQKKD